MKNLILLHGALGSRMQWQSLIPLLQDKYNVYTPDFPGHGSRTSETKADYTAALIKDLRKYVRENRLKEYYIAGYSMGGYIALIFALTKPKGLKGVFTIATKMRWNKGIAQKEAKSLEPDKLEKIHDKLKYEHGRNWQRVCLRTGNILKSIGEAPLKTRDLKDLQIPLFMAVGENDKMVTLEETSEFALAGNGKSIVLPGQPHLLERMEQSILAGKIKAFL